MFESLCMFVCAITSNLHLSALYQIECLMYICKILIFVFELTFFVEAAKLCCED